MSCLLSSVDFLTNPGLIFDVRSPAEYEQGHIPGAMCLPLFTNEERAKVGTCYKRQGKEAAVELGLTIVGPKLADFVLQAKTFSRDRTVRVHCWRGGMRSNSMAWLLETAGFQVTVLQGGYKGFRRWVRETLAVQKPVLTLGGMTGTGKTAVLHAIAAQGEQIIDLEALANHRGSSYGALGLPPQPTTEQFENLLAVAWAKLDAHRPVWIEAESRMVGTCRIPNEIFDQMQAAPIVQLERSRAERIAILTDVYGQAEQAELIAATERITRRIGGLAAKQAIAHIRRNDLAPAIALVLDYYDKTYCYDLKRRPVPISTIPATGLTASQAATHLIQTAAEWMAA